MLPEKWQNPVFKTILRIVGVQISPEAFRKASRELNTIEGQRIVDMALAKKVAEIAVADPEQVARALARFCGDEVERQRNLDAVATEAVRELESAVQADPPEAEVSEDWRRKFAQFAGDVSEPDMQALWGKILAGEIQNPGAYRYRTLRVLADLEREMAELFAEVATYRFGGDSIFTPREWEEGEKFAKSKRLQDAGLMQDAPGGSARYALKNKLNTYAFENDGAQLTLYGTPDSPERLSVPIALLTQAGIQLLPLLEPADTAEVLRIVATTLKSADLPVAQLVTAQGKTEFLWGDEAVLRETLGITNLTRPQPVIRPWGVGL